MSRIIVLYSFVVLFLHLGVISATPMTYATDSDTVDGVRHAAALLSSNEQQQPHQHYLHSMISELLTKVLIDPLKHMVTMMAVYLEIFSVACGSHVISSTNTDGSHTRDREQQLIAIASTNLWLKLPLTETLNDVFINASLAVIPSILLENSSSQAIPGIIEDMFERIEKSILANASLAPLYREEKAKAEKLSLGPLANGTGNPDTVYEMYPRFRAFIVRRQLLEHLSGSDLKTNNSVQFQRHLLSQAVIRLAKTSKSDRVQEIFDQAVQTTLEKIDSTSKTADLNGVIDEILFSTLEDKFKTTPEVENEFAAIKNEILKKYNA